MKKEQQINLNTMLGTIIYVAIIGTGSCGDYHESTIFCSLDKTKVEKWVDRFNKIIEGNTERIIKYNDYTKEAPFWYDYIVWEQPTALMREIPIR